MPLAKVGATGAGGTAADAVAGSVRPWMASLVAGPVIGLSAVVCLLGSAALAFPAGLGPHVGAVIGTMLAGAILAATWGALRATVPATLLEPQEAPAMLLGLMGIAIHGALPAGLAESERVATVIAAYGLTTLATGSFFLLLGSLRLGELIRYIPFPVVGGVLAGLGTLIIGGALSVVTGLQVSPATLPTLAGADMVARWAPALGFALVLALVATRFRHFTTIPLLLLLATLVFYAVVAGSGRSMAHMAAEGWLLGPFPHGDLLQAVDYGALARLDWDMLLAMAPEMASVVLVASIGLLLHASGLELGLRREVELDRELRVCGAGNIAAGLLGGTPTFHSLSNTLLAHTMQAGSRLTALVAVALFAVVLLFGGGLLGHFPRPVLGGLLLFLGGSLMWEWLVQGYRRLPLGDWLVVLLIVLTVVLVGYMEGLALGVVAGILLFQVGYTRVEVVKHALSGAELRSNVERAEPAMAALEEHGGRILVLRLQAYIFFGTANKVVRRLRSHLDAPGARIDWLVLDCQHVRGLDWAAVNSFRRLLQVAEQAGIRVVLSVTGLRVLEMLARGGIVGRGGARPFRSLDLAMEWCEDRLLEELGIDAGAAAEPGTLPEMVRRAFPDREEQVRLRRYLVELRLQQGDVLMRQGEKSTAMLLIQGGTASVHVEDAGGRRVRVKSYQGGALLGEVGLYAGSARTATVVADSVVVAFALTRRQLAVMRRRDPELAWRLDALVVGLLCRKLATTNQLVSRLLD